LRHPDNHESANEILGHAVEAELVTGGV
jgi:hypothetical protein